MRSDGAGTRSASDIATVPEPERYQLIEAMKAPGRA
jgi:hypothetical protein